MSFFDELKSNLVQANESAHGARLLNEFQDSVAKMGIMPSDQSDEIISRFVGKRSKLAPAALNWTRDGHIKMASTLKAEGRRRLDFDVIEGYALWMTAAWLESGVRDDDKARHVYKQLDGLARAHEVAALKDYSAKDKSSLGITVEEIKGIPLEIYDDVKEYTAVALFKMLAQVHIDVNLRSSAIKQMAFSISDLLVISAFATGIIISIAKKFNTDVKVLLSYAETLFSELGLEGDIFNEGKQTAIHEYSPQTKLPYGIAAWHAVEAFRSLENGTTADLDCSRLRRKLYEDRWY